MELDEHGTSWARAADLLERYNLPYTWPPQSRRILIGSLGGNGPVILRGILREQRAWCRVLEFAEEYGISAGFEPFTLLERLGD